MFPNLVSPNLVSPDLVSPDLVSPEPMSRSTIDMVDVGQACTLLRVDDTELLALVNSDELAVYQLGEQLRFRYRDVESLASRRAIAA